MTRTRAARVTAVGLVIVGVAYSWFAAGARPFSALAYTYVAVVSFVALVLFGLLGGFSTRDDVRDYYRSRSFHASWKSTAPWSLIALCALVLECVGLALGGQSSSVPTLSTTVDHLLVDHWVRGLLFLAWLFVGASPLFRLYRARPRSR